MRHILNNANSSEFTPYVTLDSEGIHYGNATKIAEAIAGDIVYKTADGKFKAVSPAGWDASLGTAVGVCVIPTSHDVYGDGSCAILSLSQATAQWGGDGTDISGLTNVTTVPIVSDITTQATTSTYSLCYLSSDKFTGDFDANPLDSGTKWYKKGVTNACPSPYAKDGSRNTLVNVGALKDFDGINNTAKIIAKLTTLGETNIAAQVASTLGTEGDGLTWYLPACGELAYILPRFNKINEGLSRVGTPMGESVTFWSSSEGGNHVARIVNTNNGLVTYTTKYYSNRVLGFARVTLD